MKKIIIPVAIASLCLLLAGAALFYFYFIRIDAGCASGPSRTGRACYAIKLFDMVPVARAEMEVVPKTREGIRAATLTITAVGLAERLAGRVSFEVTSTFHASTLLPLSFVVSQYDNGAARYTRFSTYDFKAGKVAWAKRHHPSRGRKDLERTFALADGAFSPLSAVYHLMEAHVQGERADVLTVQADGVPYIMRLAGVAEVQTSTGKATRYSFVISKDAGALEPWRRKKELSLDLYFSPPAEGSPQWPPFPFKAELPFGILTFDLWRGVLAP